MSLTEEAEAINWYEQRMALEKDKSARAIMKNAQKEEMKHFSMDLEWLLRKKPLWREIAQGVLFTDGDIVAEGDEAEEKADEPRGFEERRIRDEAVRYNGRTRIPRVRETITSELSRSSDGLLERGSKATRQCKGAGDCRRDENHDDVFSHLGFLCVAAHST